MSFLSRKQLWRRVVSVGMRKPRIFPLLPSNLTNNNSMSPLSEAVTNDDIRNCRSDITSHSMSSVEPTTSTVERKVRFASFDEVMLIPTRHEVIRESNNVYYTKEDIKFMQDQALQELSMSGDKMMKRRVESIKRSLLVRPRHNHYSKRITKTAAAATTNTNNLIYTRPVYVSVQPDDVGSESSLREALFLMTQ